MVRSDAKEIARQSTHQMVVFSLRDQEYGVDIAQVREIIRHDEVTRVPRAPEFVEGVLNLRGKVIPVVDLRRRFGISSEEESSAERIMVVDVADRTMGVIVDSVVEVLRVPESSMEPPPSLVAGLDAEYLRGVAKLGDRLLIWLDLTRILTSKERIQLDQLALQTAAYGRAAPSTP